MFKKILIALTVFVVICGGGLYYWMTTSIKNNSEAATKAINTTVPALTLTDVRTNQSLTLKDLGGKPIFLNFWATWCPPCVGEMPHMNELYTDYKDKIRFVAVSTDSSIDAPKNFIEQKGYAFPVYFGDNNAIMHDYSLVGIPTSYIINAEGTIIAAHVGGMSKEDMKNFIESGL